MSNPDGKKKTIHLFTHGEKKTGANPNMTSRGMDVVSCLRRHVPKQPSQLWVGEAARHWDVASALELLGDGASFQLMPMCSSVWGSAGSVEKIDNEIVIVLADGRKIPYAQCTSAADGAPAVQAKLLGDDVLDGAVICAGREVVIALGETPATAKSAAYYRVTVEGSTITHELVNIGSIPMPD